MLSVSRPFLACSKAKYQRYLDSGQRPKYYNQYGCGNYHAWELNKEYVGLMLRATHWKHTGPNWGFYFPRISLHRSNVIRFTLTISLNGYDLQAQLGIRYKKYK